MGCVLDWRRAAFWRRADFIETWRKAKETGLGSQAAAIAVLLQSSPCVAASPSSACSSRVTCTCLPWHGRAWNQSWLNYSCGLPVRAEARQVPQPGTPVGSELEKAASELLQARSLLIAGQAGLCCNPRCAGGATFSPSPLYSPVPVMGCTLSTHECSHPCDLLSAMLCPERTCVDPIVGGVLAPGALTCVAGMSGACTRCAAGEAASTGASAQELA